MEDAAKVKQAVIEKKKDTSSTVMLAYELAIGSMVSELKMLVTLKLDDGNAAWDHLVSAEELAERAINVYPDESKNEFVDSLSGHLERLKRLEQLLFPPMIFVSMGFEIRASHCSICKADWGKFKKCKNGHVKGNAYEGQLCVREITEAIPHETSIVTEPASKRHRILGGGNIDWITLKPSSSE